MEKSRKSREIEGSLLLSPSSRKKSRKIILEKLLEKLGDLWEVKKNQETNRNFRANWGIERNQGNIKKSRSIIIIIIIINFHQVWCFFVTNFHYKFSWQIFVMLLRDVFQRMVYSKNIKMYKKLFSTCNLNLYISVS